MNLMIYFNYSNYRFIIGFCRNIRQSRNIRSQTHQESTIQTPCFTTFPHLKVKLKAQPQPTTNVAMSRYQQQQQQQKQIVITLHILSLCIPPPISTDILEGHTTIRI